MKNLIFPISLIFFILINIEQNFAQENNRIKKKYNPKDFIERKELILMVHKDNIGLYDTNIVRLIPKDSVKIIDSDEYFYSLKKIGNYRILPVYLKRNKSPYEIYDTILHVRRLYKHD